MPEFCLSQLSPSCSFRKVSGHPLQTHFCEFLKRFVVLRAIIGIFHHFSKKLLYFLKKWIKIYKSFSNKCDKTKTTLVFDNVGQLVVEYGILNSFCELVQNSILHNSLANIIKHLCGFSIRLLVPIMPRPRKKIYKYTFINVTLLYSR